MITEKESIKCEAVFSEDHRHRYLWKRIWNKDKPMIAVIMINPSVADGIVMDMTTFLVVNNIARLEEYGGVEVVNLYSLISSKLEFRWNSDEDLNTEYNDDYIKKAASECDKVVVAWGRSPDTNQRMADRADQVLSLLKEYKSKLYVITDGERSNLHPLTPSIRSSWELETFEEGMTREAARKEAMRQEKEKKHAEKEAAAETANEALLTQPEWSTSTEDEQDNTDSENTVEDEQ